jgi:hypothetical protein
MAIQEHPEDSRLAAVTRREGGRRVKTWIGIDPGPSCGVVVLIWEDGTWRILAFQCNADALEELLRWLFMRFHPDAAAIELFVTSNKAGSKGADADITRMLVALVIMLCTEYGVPVVRNRATDVKPWALDKRLLRIGFPMGRKFLDARDACRHALYGAVRHGKVPDPLL